MSRAYCCEACDVADPHWTIMRTGDVVTAWACDAHLAIVCEQLQRDPEITELTVRDSRKAREWSAIGQSLNQIAGDDTR